MKSNGWQLIGTKTVEGAGKVSLWRKKGTTNEIERRSDGRGFQPGKEIPVWQWAISTHVPEDVCLMTEFNFPRGRSREWLYTRGTGFFEKGWTHERSDLVWVRPLVKVCSDGESSIKAPTGIIPQDPDNGFSG